jgi:WhiB family redox-sensing transcriptional regulator
VDPEVFFPVGVTGVAVTAIAAAKAICADCDAQSACLEFALTTNQEYGIWGGTSEEERRDLRRARRAARRLRRAS